MVTEQYFHSILLQPPGPFFILWTIYLFHPTIFIFFGKNEVEVL